MSTPMFSGRAGARAGNFEHFLKTFREKKTEVTFGFEGDPLEDGKLFNYREHFDFRTTMPGARKAGVSYPCVLAEEGNTDCIGCDYPVEHVEWTDEYLKSDEGKAQFGADLNAARQNRRKLDPGWGVRSASSRWVVPIFDGDGNVNLYKIGFTFIKYLRDIQEQVGPIDAQRFFVLKLGEQLDTTYSLLPTNQPPWKPERDIPTWADVSAILGKNYLEAFQVYVENGLTTEEGRPTGAAVEPQQADEAQAEPPVPTPASDAAKARADEPKMPAGLDGVDIPEGWDPFLDARQASVGEMKDWLDNDPRGKHEYPPRAPRPVLVSMVEKAQTPF